MDDRYCRSAERIRESIRSGSSTPALFRHELLQVPFIDRDVWVDAVFGLDELPEDGPELPLGCVPYLPCAVDTLLRLTDVLPIRSEDVFVDIGAGMGRAAVLMHLLTGARAIGVEVQSAFVQSARGLAERLGLFDVQFIPGEALQIVEQIPAASVFFLYCPFSGERLMRFLERIEKHARTRRIAICTVDLPLPEVSWLERVATDGGDLALYRSQQSS